MLEKYIKDTIFTLEAKQIAESMKGIVDVHSTRHRELSVEVCFDSSITSKTVVLIEELFLKLDAHRKPSLLTLFEAHKTAREDKGVTWAVPSKAVSLLEIRKLPFSRKKKWREETKRWDTCHHCGKLYHPKSLYKCSRKAKGSNSAKKISKERKCKYRHSSLSSLLTPY